MSLEPRKLLSQHGERGEHGEHGLPRVETTGVPTFLDAVVIGGGIIFTICLPITTFGPSLFSFDNRSDPSSSGQLIFFDDTLALRAVLTLCETLSKADTGPFFVGELVVGVMSAPCAANGSFVAGSVAADKSREAVLSLRRSVSVV